MAGILIFIALCVFFIIIYTFYLLNKAEKHIKKEESVIELKDGKNLFDKQKEELLKNDLDIYYYSNITIREFFKKLLIQDKMEKNIDNYGKEISCKDKFPIENSSMQYGYVRIYGIKYQIAYGNKNFQGDLISNPIIFSNKTLSGSIHSRTSKEDIMYINDLRCEYNVLEWRNFEDFYNGHLKFIHKEIENISDKDIKKFIMNYYDKYGFNKNINKLNNNFFIILLNKKLPIEEISILDFVNKKINDIFKQQKESTKAITEIKNYDLILKYETVMENFINSLPKLYFLDFYNRVEFRFFLRHNLPLISDYIELFLDSYSLKYKDYDNDDLNHLIVNIKEIIYKDNKLEESFYSQFFVYYLLVESIKRIYAVQAEKEFCLKIDNYLSHYLGNNLIVHDNQYNISKLTFYATYFKNEFKNFEEANEVLFKRIKEFKENESKKFLKQRLLSNHGEIKGICEKVVNINDIDNMKGLDFEKYISELFFKKGFNAVTTKTSGDQGIDVILEKNGQKIGIQCKRYNKHVSNKAIQEAAAGKAFYNLDKVMVITNSYFTMSAKELAKVNDIELWDRDVLIKNII